MIAMVIIYDDADDGDNDNDVDGYEKTWVAIR